MAVRNPLIGLVAFHVAAVVLLAMGVAFSATRALAHHPAEGRVAASQAAVMSSGAAANANIVFAVSRQTLHEISNACPDRSPLGCSCRPAAALPSGPHPPVCTAPVAGALVAYVVPKGTTSHQRSLPRRFVLHPGPVGARAPPLAVYVA